MLSFNLVLRVNFGCVGIILSKQECSYGSHEVLIRREDDDGNTTLKTSEFPRTEQFLIYLLVLDAGKVGDIRMELNDLEIYATSYASARSAATAAAAAGAAAGPGGADDAFKMEVTQIVGFFLKH